MELNTSLDVAVVGNVGIDTSVFNSGIEVNFDVETHFTENLDMIGQAGGYTTLGYSRLGKKTAFIGSIGNDYHGNFIKREFEINNIDLSALFIDPQGTARSINFMYTGGRRLNFYDGKGHMNLLPDFGRCAEIFRRSKLAHFHLPNWARLLLPIARELGLTIACDIQDIIHENEPYRQDFIQFANILFFSATNHPNPSNILMALMQINPQSIVICGMGSKGCALGNAGEIQFFEPIQDSNPVIDTNGAGDSLAVGFLSSYVLDSYTLQESVLRGQIAARHVCSIKGNSSDLITYKLLESRYQNIKSSSKGKR